MSKSNTKKYSKRKSGNKTYKKKHDKKIRGGRHTIKGKKGGYFWPFTSTPTTQPVPDNTQKSTNGISNLFGLLKTPTKQELLDNLEKEKKKCNDEINVKIDKINSSDNQNTQTTTMNPMNAPAIAQQSETRPPESFPQQQAAQPQAAQPQQQQAQGNRFMNGGKKRRRRTSAAF